MYSTRNKRDPTKARKAQEVHFMPFLQASCSIHRKHCGSVMIRLWAIDRSASKSRQGCCLSPLCRTKAGVHRPPEISAFVLVGIEVKAQRSRPDEGDVIALPLPGRGL